MNTATLKVDRFLLVYAIALFLCFSPFKKLSLLTPFLVLFLMLFFVKVRQGRNFLNLIVFFGIYLSIGLIYYFINPDFHWINCIFFFITTSPFLLLLVSFEELINHSFIEKVSSLTIKVLVLEAAIGIIQFMYNGLFCAGRFDGGTGDAAMGTVNPILGVGDGLGSNVYYAIALSALGVLAVTSKWYEKKKVSLVVLTILIFGWIGASVMHSIFLLLGSILFNLLIVIFFMPKNRLSFISKQLKIITSSILLMLVLVIVILSLLPNSVSRLNGYYHKTFNLENPKSTKSRATIASVVEFNKNKSYQKYVGIGPGQYCSKASMILSGTYLSSKIPDFLKSVTPDLKKIILPIWLEYKSRKLQAGSTFFPFYSWLSLYGEFGLLGFFVLLLLIARLYKKLLTVVNQSNFVLILGLLIVVIYIFFLGVQDNYWEWSQFILPILLYAKMLYYVAIKPTELNAA